MSKIDDTQQKKPTSLDDIQEAMSSVDEPEEQEDGIEEEKNEVEVEEEKVEPEEDDEKTETEETDNEQPRYATPNALGQHLPPDSDGANLGQSLINIESMINRYVGDIDKLKEQMKTQKDMLNDAVHNDAEYAQQENKAKEINRVKNAAKQKVMKQPAVAVVVDRVNEIKEEIKEMQEALSSYLQQYQKIAGTNQLISENGDIREIVTIHRLVKKSRSKP